MTRSLVSLHKNYFINKTLQETLPLSVYKKGLEIIRLNNKLFLYDIFTDFSKFFSEFCAFNALEIDIYFISVFKYLFL